MIRVDKSLTDDSGAFTLSVHNTDFNNRPAYVVVRCQGKVVFEGIVTGQKTAHLSVTVEARPAEQEKGCK